MYIMATSKTMRVSSKTKNKLDLVRKEIIRIDPKMEEMYLADNYVVNRMANFFLKGSPYEKVGETE